jgi:gamma-glutamylcyclotransferase (GGCT)/AIG2-like uncharacterized protein YtfP
MASSQPRHSYFAYGSNMSAAQMAGRCPGAGFPRLGWVAGYEQVINQRGVATLCEAALGEIYGVVWTLTTADVVALDRFEGVDEGRYSRTEIVVQTSEGPEVALVYLDHRRVAGSPRPGYLERVVHGATEHGLPPEYVERLRSALVTVA